MIGWGWMLACGTPSVPHEAAHDAPHEDHHGDHATMTHRFEDPEKWAAVFDDPARDAWQRPADVVAAMQIRPGQRVADLGAGTGYLVPYLADAVGPEGRVIALDVESTLVDHMTTRFADRSTVEARLTPMDSASLQPGEVDHVVLLDVYHHLSDRKAYFTNLRASMRPGGQLTVVDFDPKAEGTRGSPPEHRIAPSQVTRELRDAGWLALPTEVDLPDQYVVRFAMARANADVAWLAAQPTPAQLIDVRTPPEFAQGRIPGTRNVPLGTLNVEAMGLDRSQPVILVCASGGRSSQAADQFAAAGYQAINLVGGTRAWASAGHELER